MSEYPNLKGRVAVVTGATSGIGKAIGEALAGAGADVAIVGRNVERLAEVEDSLRQRGGNVLPLKVDVRSESDMEAMAERTLDRFGRIDILVAAAGIARSPSRIVPTPLAQLPRTEWTDVMESNLTGVFLSNRAVLPAMIGQRRGDILNISSYPAGLTGQPFAAVYSASKFGVIGLSESLQEEVRMYGIRVQTLLPGPTDTRIFGNSAASRFGPLMPAAQVAEMALYLIQLPSDTTIEAAVIKAR